MVVQQASEIGQDERPFLLLEALNEAGSTCQTAFLEFRRAAAWFKIATLLARKHNYGRRLGPFAEQCRLIRCRPPYVRGRHGLRSRPSLGEQPRYCRNQQAR